MRNLAYCLTQQHDWRFVAGAVALCIFGLATAVALLSLAHAGQGARRRLLGAGAAVVAGLAVWSTHFLAMMGYRPGPQPHFDALTTFASLLIIIAGMGLCVAVALSGPGRGRQVAAGLIAACAVSAMHFVGLSGVVVLGARLQLDPAGVAAAVAACLLLAGSAGLAARRLAGWRPLVTTLLAAVSVAVLHFGAMGATTLVPAAVAPTADDLTGAAMLAATLAGVGCILLVAAAIAALAWWSRASAHRHLDEAIQAMPSGLAFYDAQDRLLVWNARYADAAPELRDHLVKGAAFSDLLRRAVATGSDLSAHGREADWIAERLAARRAGTDVLEQQGEGGVWRQVQDRRTRAGGTVSVVTDITDLKRDAQALAEARDAAEGANRAKSAFLANMSHEIRTPLNGVLGLAQALARTELTEEQVGMLALIQSSGLTLQTLLSDILDLARVEAGRVEVVRQPFDLARTVQEAAQLYAAVAHDKGLAFQVAIDPTAHVYTLGDSVRLKQILTNLISNAVKFTASGSVRLSVNIGASPTGGEVALFQVTDTGVGFDAETRERLFSRFEQADGSITRRFGGSGLGLAISHQLAGLMGGELTCTSDVGHGSTFTLALPHTAAAPAVAAPPAEPAAPAAEPLEGERMRVLLADDHATNRRVVELILGPLDVDVVSVENGEQALAACRTGDYDLILMDMQMPVMDGLTATREIRALEAATGRGRTPLIMLTANVLPEHIAAGQAAGADGHLAKPFLVADLLTLIANLSDREAALAA